MVFVRQGTSGSQDRYVAFEALVTLAVLALPGENTLLTPSAARASLRSPATHTPHRDSATTARAVTSGLP